MQAYILALALALSGQSPTDNSRLPDDIMKRIERKVVLPGGSRPFAEYGRNYAFSGADEVRATYMIPPTLFGQHTSCWKGGEPCPSQEKQRLADQSVAARASQAAANESRWFDDEKALPRIDDGGCREINIRYRVSTDEIVMTACNGR